MKILTVNELEQIDPVDYLVKERMVEKIEVLNENYGENRSLSDLGGFVIYVDNIGVIKELLEQFPVAEAEYTEIFSGADEKPYAEIVLLVASDYHIVIFMPVDLLEKYPNLNVNE